MSDWKDDDEVTTTYGSIQLSLSQAHSAGIKTERERIIKLLEQEKLEFLSCFGDPDLIKNDAAIMEYLIALIKGGTNE